MKIKQLIQLEKKLIMHSYSRFPIAIAKGKGSYVTDTQGKKYLDFIGGLATCTIGHANKQVIQAIQQQAKKLINATNLYYTEPQIKLAQQLTKHSGLAKCFFCNSGTEANETAIKLAKKVTKKSQIISFQDGFHGRTLGSLAATWKTKYKKIFEPLVPGFIFVKYNDAEALEKAITKQTAAVMIEPIQGEGGVNVPDKGYLKAVEKICSKHKILLIIDEIQSGNGRTGKFFAFKRENVKPDIVTAAKGLANGVPIGVCIAKKGLDFQPGDHGSTFGGNNLSCAAAIATISYLENKKVMKNAETLGLYFVQELEQLKAKNLFIKQVKGIGLMLAMKLNKKGHGIVNDCLKKGLLINCVADYNIRFLPPLTITKKEIDKCIKILDKVLQ